MRLDVYLTENKIYQSRERAKRAISMGLVKVNGIAVTKPAMEISEEDTISAEKDPVPFVSRGALKIAGAFDCISIDVEGKNCIDVGASTGGFTQFLLQRGASKVLAVDVGHGQLDPDLAEDPRVINAEGADIRSETLQQYENTFDFAAVDVSFIPLRLVIPSVVKYLKDGGTAVFLFKPQFEVGRKNLNKKGIVKDKKTGLKFLKDTVDFTEACGCKIIKTADSPITGGDGNTEYLIICQKTAPNV